MTFNLRHGTDSMANNQDDRFKIWEQDVPSQAYEPNGRFFRFNSPRIFGEYRIFSAHSRNLKFEIDRLAAQRGSEPERLRAQLATQLIDRIEAGEQTPTVDRKMIDKLVSDSRPLPVATRARRLLKFMTKPEFGFFQPIDVLRETQFLEAALGYSESTDKRELERFLRYLTEKGWIDQDYEFDGYYATVDGHEEVTPLKQVVNSTTVFVAMWFNKELDEVSETICSAVSSAGYDPIRIDSQHFGGLIDDKILAEIRNARFVIADLTHGHDGQRGSVYYETGFARGLGKAFIQTVRLDHLRDESPEYNVAFDLSHYPVINWEPDKLDKFKESLLERIEARSGTQSN